MTFIGLGAFEENRLGEVFIEGDPVFEYYDQFGSPFAYQNPDGGWGNGWVTFLYAPNMTVLPDEQLDRYYGGLVVNPSPLTIYYEDKDGNTLAPPVTMYGEGIYDLRISSVFAVNPDATPTDIHTLLYFAGQTVTFTPPAIAGYEAPASQTITLTAGANQSVLNFVYVSNTNSITEEQGGGVETLADTGANSWKLLTIAFLMVIPGLLVLRTRVRSRV